MNLYPWNQRSNNLNHGLTRPPPCPGRKCRSRERSRFRGESREPKWAGATEAGINSAIVGSKTDGFDVPPPDSLRVECRTSLCSVRMGYADVDDAAQMQAKLMLGIPASVAQARTFLIDGKNGGTELIIFAGNTDNLR